MTRRFKFGFVFQVMDTNCSTEEEKEEKEGEGLIAQTGSSTSADPGLSQLDYTGTVDSSSHDFLLGFLGHMDGSAHLDSGGSAAASLDQNLGSSLDLSAGHVHHFGVGFDQSGLDHAALGSGPAGSLSSSDFNPSHSANLEASSASPPPSSSDTDKEQTGNGRQTHLTDLNGVTHPPFPLTELRSALTAPPSSLGTGRDVTALSVTRIYAHTDMVTAATDLTVTDTDPTGSGLDSSRTAVTDHTQTAGPVTEQYHPSGQGPEGAENVELEDTC
ncbi:uncharacterized protein LOC103393761 isoform X2 [Cynoglossus semilaevis]|uniref:uncharacterized protein LOC103393761 isoform X2 n=1 Tax=Cynoglossus semilaevis TaxID=244447 RepID=UPI000D62B88B|nr:uncharacterized protein LOC103393761 isoform X2 [Cynoglossus semilaevis]